MLGQSRDGRRAHAQTRKNSVLKPETFRAQTRKSEAIKHKGGCLHIYSDNLALELAVHAVTWGRRDSWCEGQWADAQPEELPSQPVTTSISRVELAPGKPAFTKFDFGRWT